MLNPFRNQADLKLQALIDDVIVRMNDVGVDSDDYPKHLAQLERLNELKNKNKPRISRDTLVKVGGNVFIAVAMIAYERTHVVTSKALGRISSPGTMDY